MNYKKYMNPSIALPALALLLWTLLTSSAVLAASPSIAPKRDVPTNITASSMVYNADVQTVIFTGNVHVKRPDFEVWSERLTVYLKKSGQKAKADDSMAGMAAGDIDRIVAEKNVRMKSEEKQGRCQKATYYANTELFVMEGSPVLTEKDNTIKGAKIEHNMKTNRSQVFSGGNAPVEAQFTTQEQNSKKGL